MGRVFRVMGLYFFLWDYIFLKKDFYLLLKNKLKINVKGENSENCVFSMGLVFLWVWDLFFV